MNLATLRAAMDSHSRWEKLAVLIWGGLLLFVSVRVFLAPEAKTVYPIFSASGRLWWAGVDLYEPHRPPEALDGFRYSPTFAILVTPFALVPDRVGGVLWRLLNLAVFLGAVGWLTRSVLAAQLSTKHYAWLLLLIVPLSLQSVNNGQVNLIVIAAMLGAVAAVSEQRWNLASALLALAFLIKLYPLALGLVLLVLHPRQLGLRLPLALLGSLALPFACQTPDYVSDQYAKWIALLRTEDRSDILREHMYRDLWLLIHLYGLPISRSIYLGLQLAAGAGIALLCWRRQQTGWPTPALMTSTLALTTAWMMLLGPATESSSFVLLAPSIAWSIVESLQHPDTHWRRAWLWMSCASFIAAVVLGSFRSTVLAHGLGIHSWGSIFYFVHLLIERRLTEVQVMQHVEPKRLAA